jgi:hypothetical protein
MFATSLELKQSSINNAGNGIFTTNFIKKSSPVCYYAGKDEPKSSNVTDPYALEDPFVPGNVRIGFKHIEGSHGSGQILNDSCLLDPSKLPLNENGIFTISSFNKLKDIYISCSKKKANVSFFQPGEKWTFYALRDIEAGEELFWHYGEHYWITDFLKTCEYPLHKVVALFDLGRRCAESKNYKDCKSFMMMVGIGPVTQGKLGCDTKSTDSEKLSHIIRLVNQIAK